MGALPAQPKRPDSERVVLCWPVCIEGARYARNALIYSLGFVLDTESETPAEGECDTRLVDSRTCERFGRVLEKACGYLSSLEEDDETALISEPSRRDELEQLLLQACPPAHQPTLSSLLFP